MGSNTQLAALLEECGISHAGLARRVALLAQERGLPAPRYNHASVARWLRGEQPRGAAPDLIAHILTGAAGRPLGRADIGMRAATVPPDLALSYEPGLEVAVDTATALFDTDVHRRDGLARTAYSAAAFLVPALRWMTAPAAALADRPGSRRVGFANVAAIREVAAMFRRQDNMFGGGYARSTVVQYLADEVAPLLRHGSYTAATGRALFSAASEMTLLAGWMAYDLEQHPIAQRYLIQALRLAHEAGDEALGGEILAAMSCQAVYLGRGGDGVDMARAGARSARRAGSGALLSECLAAQAHGHARTGDTRAAAVVLVDAERALGRSGAERPSWLGYYDAPYLAARRGRVLLDSGQPVQAAEAMRESLGMAEGFNRGQAFNLAVLASALLAAGDVGGGCGAAELAAVAAAELNSRRARKELAAVGAALEAHADAAPVRALAASHPDLLSGSPAGRGRRAAR